LKKICPPTGANHISEEASAEEKEKGGHEEERQRVTDGGRGQPESQNFTLKKLNFLKEVEKKKPPEIEPGHPDHVRAFKAKPGRPISKKGEKIVRRVRSGKKKV